MMDRWIFVSSRLLSGDGKNLLFQLQLLFQTTLCNHQTSLSPLSPLTPLSPRCFPPFAQLLAERQSPPWELSVTWTCTNIFQWNWWMLMISPLHTDTLLRLRKKLNIFTIPCSASVSTVLLKCWLYNRHDRNLTLFLSVIQLAKPPKTLSLRLKFFPEVVVWVPSRMASRVVSTW